jgi:hypothetical protein
MPASRTALKILTALGLVIGIGLSIWRPQWPLLGYWLLFATSLGVAVSTLPSLSGLATRAKWLMTINALVVAVALATTQIAARRAISSTHLQYRGVHVVGIDSFTVGAGDTDADIRLQNVATTSPWSIRVAKHGQSWTVEPLAGIEQLRMSPRGNSRSSSVTDFKVAQSSILTTPGDWVAVQDPAGVVVDTLRLAAGRLESSKSNTFLLRPINGDISDRYRRQLRSGVALSGLDGHRGAPSAYERFVRVQEFSATDVVNGTRPSILQRVVWSLPLMRASWLPDRPLLVAASPPYTLRGPSLSEGHLSFTDSALFEIRNGDVAWRFQLRTWRREPSAEVGLALLFVRNPRPLDTPLPTGVSCRAGVACGAISIRRLPPPVAQVALDYAGFDPAKFGMLGMVQQDNNGYAVVLPRHVYRIERGAARPMAVPVTAFATSTSRGEAARPSPFWLLLAASGTFGDDMVTIALIGVGLALLLAAMYTGVASSAPRSRTVDRFDESSLTLGITAILALLLTRVIVGARVAFFAPFLQRSIQTAVGMWVAIAIVAVGLLSWSAWVPPLLTAARSGLAGQVAFRRFAMGFFRILSRFWTASTTPPARVPAAFTAAALVCLGIATPAAVVNGVVAGTVVLLSWVCLAWVAAFAGPYFETFERGAWSVVEQLAPGNRIAASSDAQARAGFVKRLVVWCQKMPELPIILTCLAAETALIPRMTGAMALVAVLALVMIAFVVRRRRAAAVMPGLPDYWGAIAGTSLFTLVIAALRFRSENGSMAAFVLIVFVALASVRIGRSVGSRIEAADRRGPPTLADWSELATSSALLMAPLVLLAPLMVIDMGLFLVVVVPVGFATLLAAGLHVAGRRLIIPGLVFVALFSILIPRVVFPSVRAIRDADSHAGKAAAFERMTELFGVRFPFVSTSLDRVAARSVATVDRALAEELLISAKPGPARDLLIPSIEQTWGGTTYASAGFWGGGLGQAVVGGRGVAESVSYAENTFAVFILAEHGAFGGVLVLALYLMLTVAVGSTVMTGATETPASYRASRALLLVAALIVVVPAVYVAMSNLGVVPITGQNMPFLGLNAWSDVAICAGVVGILITGAIRRMEEAVR